MYDAEGQCGDGDCCPGAGFSAQHFAFDGFAEEEFFGDGADDGECEQSPDAFRHGHRHLHHGVGQGDVLGHDGEAEASEYASGYGEQACLPPYGAEVACLNGADVSQWAVAYQYGDDVCRHDGEREHRDGHQFEEWQVGCLAVEYFLQGCSEVGRDECADAECRCGDESLCQQKDQQGE